MQRSRDSPFSIKRLYTSWIEKHFAFLFHLSVHTLLPFCVFDAANCSLDQVTL